MITINTNALNMSIIRSNNYNLLKKKKDPNVSYLAETHFKYKNRLKVKR